jgi:hypothetical protein
VLSSASEKKRRCFGVPPLADPPLVDQLVRAVFPWCQAKMRPAFARAREPSRIVDGDLKAIDERALAPEAVIIRRQTGSTRTQRPCTLSGSTRTQRPCTLYCRLAMPCFGTVPHSTGRSWASEIEEQITDTVPNHNSGLFGSASSAEMSLGVCPR